MLALSELRPLQALAASLFFKHRRLMLVLPRQYGGKTELGVRLLEDCMAQPRNIQGLFLAKDTKSGRRATREKFMRVFDRERYSVNTDRIIKRANPASAINIASVDKDPDRLRGGTFNIIHWSEAAFSKLDHGETITGVFDKVISPTTRIFDAYTLIETTLNGQNGFKDIWDNADEYGFATLLVSLTMMLEMGLIPAEEYSHIKSTTHPLVFRQEYDCQFVTFLGLTYDEFDEDIHVRNVEPPQDWQRVIVSIDWGWDPSATCALFGYVHDDIVYIFDEMYEKQQLLESTCVQIEARRAHWSIEHLAATADHEDDRIQELNRRGIPCGKAHKANVLGNRLEIKEALWNKRLVIDPRCKNLIRDLQTAVWHPKKEGDLDYSQCSYGHFDAEAALRYLIRELKNFEVEEPDANPHVAHDQASARMWQLTRQRSEDVG